LLKFPFTDNAESGRYKYPKTILGLANLPAVVPAIGQAGRFASPVLAVVI